MDNKVLIEQKETIVIHLIIIFGSGILFLGFFYSLLTFSYRNIILFTTFSLTLIFYIIPRGKTKKRKKEIYIGLILCFILSYSIIKLYLKNDMFYQIHLYYISLIIYHYSEYFSVLLYHFNKCSWHSYLIDQSKEWIFATLFGFSEFYIEMYFFPGFKNSKINVILGLITLIIGQFFRISALFTGKNSFTHLISYKKKKEHILITHGIYSISRHPSYFGFYLWSIGTQILCFNPLCIFAYTIVLFIFFKYRILEEEMYLIYFFGYDYINYKRKVPILIPFIGLSEVEEKKSLEIYKKNKEKEEKFRDTFVTQNDDESEENED
jgi:protein-S-isoprenylcysteine O-methyltransferase